MEAITMIRWTRFFILALALVPLTLAPGFARPRVPPKPGQISQGDFQAMLPLFHELAHTLMGSTMFDDEEALGNPPPTKEWASFKAGELDSMIISAYSRYVSEAKPKLTAPTEAVATPLIEALLSQAKGMSGFTGQTDPNVGAVQVPLHDMVALRARFTAIHGISAKLVKIFYGGGQLPKKKR
jgi:hypothetical protein